MRVMALSYYDIKNMLRSKDASVMPVDDFRIIDSYALYDENENVRFSDKKLDFLCYEIESVNPETGERLHFYKAIKLVRIIRLPKAAKQSTSFMDVQQQVLTAVYEQGYNMITIIANIIKPTPIGLLFLYGVQGVADTIDEAKRQAEQDFIGLTRTLQGSFRVLEMRIVTAEEAEWLREKMYNMDYITVARGIPKANKGGEDMGNKGIGGKNLNPDSQGTLEEFIAGMADYEYVVEVLSTPVFRRNLQEWSLSNEKQMTAWYSQLQGTKALSMSISMPMMYMANQSNSQGWNKAYTDAESVSYSQGESFGTNFSESVSQGISESFSESQGISHGQSVTSSTTTTQGVTHGVTTGQTIGQSLGESISQGISQNASASTNVSNSTGISQGQNMTHSESQNVSSGQSQTTGQSFGQSFGQSESTNHSVGTNQSIGTSENTSVSHGSSQSVGTSTSMGQSSSASDSFNSSSSHSASSGQSHNNGISTGESTGFNKGFNYGESNSQSDSWQSSNSSNGNVGLFGSGLGGGHTVGHSAGNSFSQNAGASFGESHSQNNGISQSWGSSASESNGFSSGQSHGVTQGSSFSQGQSTNIGTSQSISHSSGTSNSFGTSESFGTGHSTSVQESFGTSQSTSQSQSISNGESNGWGSSISQNQSVSQGQGFSQSQGTSVNHAMNQSQNVSQSQSVSQSASNSVSHGESVGHSVTQSQSQSVSHGNTQTTGQSQGTSQSVSNTQGSSTSHSIANGMSGAFVSGASTSMGFGPSVGFNKSYQWMDQQVKDILELLEFQNERIKTALRGEGAFYTYVYIACQSVDALSAASAVAKSTWQQPNAMVSPLQILRLKEAEQKHLLYHFAAFSADVTRENVGGVSQYKYSTVLLPQEYVAYTHLPRISGGGIFADVNDIPKFAVPSQLKGDIYMGTILSAERYTMQNGYKTPFDYRIDESELMHGFFTGASRSGKTVAAMRFVSELSRIKRKKTGKRLRIVCMDPKQDWRTLARFVDPKRFRFYSLGNCNFRPIKINPFKIPRGVVPQTWIDGVIDIYCRAYGLLERGKQMMGETIYALYQENGVFDACEEPNWEELVAERSANVTFEAVYKKMDSIRASLEDPMRKGKMGNDQRDAYARLLDRLQCFSRPFSVEYKLFGTSEGVGIDEMIGDDDVTILESSGLEKTFKNFIFGVITSGFYKYAKAHEGGYLAENQYETVLVIEEANEVLIGNDAAGSGSGSSSGMTISGQSEFEEILDQSAGYGLFIIAITQKIANMPKSIIANSGLVFAGRLKTQDDITVVIRSIAREERLDDRDLVKWFPRMATGMFVCQRSRTFDFKDAEPILVQIARLNAIPPTQLEIDEILTEREAQNIIDAEI